MRFPTVGELYGATSTVNSQHINHPNLRPEKSLTTDTLGKLQPNIPRWRATAVASYRLNSQLAATLGARYSGAQYRTLNNADVNGYTYQGVSKYFTADLRVRWQVSKVVTAAFGNENLNNYKYWNFYPYPQRSYMAELKFDL